MKVTTILRLTHITLPEAKFIHSQNQMKNDYFSSTAGLGALEVFSDLVLARLTA